MALPITPEQDATIKAMLGIGAPKAPAAPVSPAANDLPPASIAAPGVLPGDIGYSPDGRTQVGPALNQRHQILTDLEAMARKPSARIPAHTSPTTSKVTVHEPDAASQQEIDARKAWAAREMDLNRTVDAPVSVASSQRDANEWVARAIYADAAKRADDEERARLRQAAAMLVAKREADGPFASVAAGAGSLARAFGGTDTYQAAMDRDRLLDVQSAQNAVTLGNIAKALGESGRNAAQRERDAELEKLKAYIAAYTSNEWAQPTEGGPISVNEEGRLRVGGSPESDVSAPAAVAAAPAQTDGAAALRDEARLILGAQPQYGWHPGAEAPAAPQLAAPRIAVPPTVVPPREQFKAYLKGLAAQPSPSSELTGGIETVVPGLTSQAEAEQTANVPGAKYPVMSPEVKTRLSQKNYAHAATDMFDKAIAQRAEASRFGGTTREQDSKFHEASGGGIDKNMLLKIAQERGDELRVASAERNVDEANQSREGIAANKPVGGAGNTHPPGTAEPRLVVHAADGTYVLDDHEDAIKMRTLVGRAEAAAKAAEEFDRVAASAGNRLIDKPEVNQALGRVKAAWTGLTTAMEGTTRVNEPTQKMGLEMSGAFGADDFLRNPIYARDAMKKAVEFARSTPGSALKTSGAMRVYETPDERFGRVYTFSPPEAGAPPTGQPAGGAAPTRVKANFDAEAKK